MIIKLSVHLFLLLKKSSCRVLPAVLSVLESVIGWAITMRDFNSVVYVIGQSESFLIKIDNCNVFPNNRGTITKKVCSSAINHLTELCHQVTLGQGVVVLGQGVVVLGLGICVIHEDLLLLVFPVFFLLHQIICGNCPDDHFL